MRPLLMILLVASLHLVGARALASSITLRPRMADGREVAWVVERTTTWSNVSEGVAALEIESKVRLNLTTRVKSHSDEAFQMECIVTDVKMSVKVGAVVQEFDRSNPNPSVDSDLSRALVPLIDTPLRFSLARNGTIDSVTGLPSVSSRTRGDFQVPLEAVLGEQAWVGLLTDLFGASGGRELAEPEDTWSYSTTRSILTSGPQAAGMVRLKNSCTLAAGERMGRCHVTIAGEAQISSTQPGGPDWTSQVSSSSGSGTIEIDAATGETVAHSTKCSLDFTARPEQGLSQRGSFSETTVIKRESTSAEPGKKPAEEPAPDDPFKRDQPKRPHFQ